MTESRPETRVPVNLKVRIWGMDAGGHTFFQHVSACNISSKGAQLSGIEHELKVGEIIGLQYGDKKARCKIVWVLEAGALQKIQAGIELAGEQECPWRAELSTTESPLPVPAVNRRKWARHKISFPIEVRDERVNTPMRVNATDVSGNGCYVETILPIPVGTTLRIDFWIGSEKTSTLATVRTCDPGVGMGIELTGLPEADRHRLQRELEKLDPGISGSLNPNQPS